MNNLSYNEDKADLIRKAAVNEAFKFLENPDDLDVLERLIEYGTILKNIKNESEGAYSNGY